MRLFVVWVGVDNEGGKLFPRAAAVDVDVGKMEKRSSFEHCNVKRFE